MASREYDFESRQQARFASQLFDLPPEFRGFLIIESEGDFAAQLAANRAGVARLGRLIVSRRINGFVNGIRALNDYAERLAADALGDIPDGRYSFTDYLDDDGVGRDPEWR